MIGDVLKDTAELHGVTVRELRGGRRFRSHVAARHAAAWVLRQATPMTEQEIAAAVGLQHHTTVIHALTKVEQRMASDPAYAADLWEIVHRQTYRAQSEAAEPQPQKLPGSPDRWAIWNRRQHGSGITISA